MLGGTHQVNEQHGFSIVETLVVIIIISIVSAIAFMQRGSANSQFQRQNIARELKVSFERGRFDSVKRRADSSGIQARVLVDTGAYTLTTYKDVSGTMTAAPVTSSFSAQNIVIAGYGGLTLPYTVYYNQRGEAVDSSGASISPKFLVCNVSCSSPTVANSNIVLVTPTGTVNLLAGGSSIPTFTAPTITTVPPTSSINNTVTVP
jgi:prepilin-type N-terminal cleavage/methylation domain-containing protein